MSWWPCTASESGGFDQWYNPVWYSPDYLPSTKADLVKLRKAFETAVIRRMMSDVPWGKER